LLTACSALALASCGGEEQKVAPPPPPPPPAPTIAASVASPLAGRSEKVAALLDAGDTCGAFTEAASLRSDLTAAINQGAIPQLYLEDLSALVNEIAAQIPPCRQPPQADDDHGKEKEKGKHGKHGKHKDDEGDD
jgi:hypothetical protein